MKAICPDCKEAILIAIFAGEIRFFNWNSEQFYIATGTVDYIKPRIGFTEHKCKKEDKKYKNGIYCSACKTESYPENLHLSFSSPTYYICPECRSKGIITLSWIEK